MFRWVFWKFGSEVSEASGGPAHYPLSVFIRPDAALRNGRYLCSQRSVAYLATPRSCPVLLGAGAADL